MAQRGHISMTTKCASALLQLRDPATGELLIPYEHAKLMTSDQIISLFQFDHGILHAFDPIDEAWNLTPRLIVAHREKSKRDKAITAKAARIDKMNAAHAVAMAEPAPTDPVPVPARRSRIPSRPFPKQYRPLRSRSDFARRGK